MTKIKYNTIKNNHRLTEYDDVRESVIEHHAKLRLRKNDNDNIC
jgi:hypothetical protein